MLKNEKKIVNIVYLNKNLRIKDNIPLHQASQTGAPIIPIFIFNPKEKNLLEKEWGEASRWWLYHSLSSLNGEKGFAGKIHFLLGNIEENITQLCSQYHVSGIYWQEHYTELDKELRLAAEKNGISSYPCPGMTLWQPSSILRTDGDYYKVFTHFYRNGCLKSPHQPQKPLGIPNLQLLAEPTKKLLQLSDLEILPSIKWHSKFDNIWDVGETAAEKRLKEFIKNDLLSYDQKQGYKKARDYPELQSTSRLSPHLHFGEISPRQVWHAIKNNLPPKIVSNCDSDPDVTHFLSEIGWREFSYYLLYHFPQLSHKNFNHKFDNFPWSNPHENLEAWKKGKTGYPLVDAGMRELWQTGYMHNRVRMVVGSFLVKNLHIDWRHGAQWFMDCLVDADIANNSAGWQWVAGCGADAAPYFRIFNPILQSEKFDPNGKYIKKYVPELRNLDKNFIHRPWENKEPVKDYPEPIVDSGKTRQEALDAYNSIKNT